MDITEYNRLAWDRRVEEGDEWTIPVGAAEIAAARMGRWHVVLTPSRAVPRDWFPPLEETRTLCLAGSGGQQAPILAAAGARVTVFDNSPRQLAQDRFVAGRDGLDIVTVQGDMRDLSVLADASFDLVVHPCSNCFVPEIRGVWREVARVLAPGGVLLAGFINPMSFIFDEEAADRGDLVVRHRLPYRDDTHLDTAQLAALQDRGEPMVFSHSLEEQIGGQLEVGLTLTAILEDDWPGKPLSMFAPSFIATRAVKLR
ncbi:MAG: class I SAM-dependent methyltransferase [Acidobacteria bacterium]|nr:class I SAM-dependent methyltransferase [Acidobacteriota bacterium]